MTKQFYLLALFCLMATAACYSQAGMYIKISTINGDQTGVHAGEFIGSAFEVTDSSTYVRAAGSGGGSGKAYAGLAKIKKVLVPIANPELMTAIFNGKHYSTLSITWYNASNVAYYQINLTDVVFVRGSVLAPECIGGNCQNLYEELYVNYSTIQFKDPVSGTAKGWDVTRNTTF